jgi:hypothetical protein
MDAVLQMEEAIWNDTRQQKITEETFLLLFPWTIP